MSAPDDQKPSPYHGHDRTSASVSGESTGPSQPGFPEAPYIPKTEESAFKTHEGAQLIREEDDFQENERTSHVDVVHLHDEVIKETVAKNGGSIPITTPMLSLFGCVILWAGVYLGLYNGGFSAEQFSEKSGTANAGPVMPADPKVVGQKLFVANCAQCHQTTGLGVPGQFPPLVGSEWVIGNAPNRLTQIVFHGVQGPIRVKGQTFNSQMPAWGAQFNDEQIASILTYVRSEWGNSAPAISKEEVAAARKETLSRTDAWSEPELLQLPAGLSGDSKSGDSKSSDSKEATPAPQTKS